MVLSVGFRHKGEAPRHRSVLLLYRSGESVALDRTSLTKKLTLCASRRLSPASLTYAGSRSFRSSRHKYSSASWLPLRPPTS